MGRIVLGQLAKRVLLLDIIGQLKHKNEGVERVRGAHESVCEAEEEMERSKCTAVREKHTKTNYGDRHPFANRFFIPRFKNGRKTNEGRDTTSWYPIHSASFVRYHTAKPVGDNFTNATGDGNLTVPFVENIAVNDENLWGSGNSRTGP